MSYNYKKFDMARGWQFEHIRQTFTATAGGNFRKKPDSTTIETVDSEFYVNFVRSIPFFNNPGLGESCRASWLYTPAGYIPAWIVTSKKGYKKYIDTFKPIDRKRGK